MNGHSQFEDLKKNSVSHDRIREKIEEIEKLPLDSFEGSLIIIKMGIRKGKIESLKELLEEDDG